MQETKTINGTGGGTFATSWGYDSLDRPIWMIYPGGSGGQQGETVNFNYQANGALNQVWGAQTYVVGTGYDAAGRLDVRHLGWTGSAAVLTQDYTYNAWTTQGGRLQKITVGIPSNLTSLQDLRYTYDYVGNVLAIQDYKAGISATVPQTQTFTYDHLDRLRTAVAAGGASDNGNFNTETYTYTVTGSLTGKAAMTLSYPANSPTGGVCTSGTPTTKPHADY